MGMKQGLEGQTRAQRQGDFNVLWTVMGGD